ncbi:MAG: hypothetical protein QM756_21295 [Polyangiaceae bacterium]
MDFRARTLSRTRFAPRGGAIGLLCALVTLLSAAVSHAESSSLDPAIGYNYGEIETARTAATGGAQRAVSNSLGALFVNPANIARERVYHLGAFAQLWPEARRQSYGAAASDSANSGSPLAAAAGITYNFQDPDGVNRRWTDLRIAVAYPFSDKFSFGLGGRYLWLTRNGLGPLGLSSVSNGLAGQQIVRTFSFDAGATLRPVPELSLAFVGSNLSNPGHGFFPTTLGGGIGYGSRQVVLEGDLVADFTTWDSTRLRAMIGAELLLADHYGLRGGYRYDQGADSHGLSFGAAYIDSLFILDAAVRHTFVGGSATAVVLGFTYHLESSGLTPTAGETF